MTKCILVVDDHADVINILRQALEYSGFDVLTAQTGEEALRKFEYGEPDAVVIDLYLPGLPGWEVCSKIKARRRVPIIVLTVHPLNATAARGVAPDADEYFVKPIDVWFLSDQLRKILGMPKADLDSASAATHRSS